MIVAIHQPNYLPWLGYFYKLLQCDVFIILDDVQFVPLMRKGHVKTPQGTKWLTVPCAGKSSRRAIYDILIDNSSNWIQKHLATLHHSYAHCKQYALYYDKILNILNRKETVLSNLNELLIRTFAIQLKVNCRLIKASSLSVDGCSEQRIINLVKAVGGTTYLSGNGARAYQSTSNFAINGIQLIYSDFECKLYPQQWGDFIPNLSIVDLLFNCGSEDSRERLLAMNGKQ